MPKLAFQLIHPSRRTSCAVFASPHSGNDYPESFLEQTLLNETSIRSSEDAFVDVLFASASHYGAPFIKAEAPRAFVDVNRAQEELDPALIQGVTEKQHNPRVAAGLGIIPRVVAGNRAIYNGKISRAEASYRIETYWEPYHNTLSLLMDSAKRQFDCGILIDCHSMPRESLNSFIRCGAKRPEIVLGDRFGAAASKDVVTYIEAAFVNAGFYVLRNQPFAGAYTVQRYGKPKSNMHAIQVEIDRSLYMDESTLTPNIHFEDVKTRLEQAIAQIAAFVSKDMLPHAAE